MIETAYEYVRNVTKRSNPYTCSIFERFNLVTKLRIVSHLRLLREYVRGDADVIRDILDGYDTYDLLFPEDY